MLMIMTFHYFKHSNALSTISADAPGYNLMWFIYSNTVVAVNCFVLISGYFGIVFRKEKFIRFELQMIFYSVLIFLFSALYLKTVSIGFSQIKYNLFPTISRVWWFMTDYMGLMLVSPLLNIIVDHTDKKKLQTIILGLSIALVLLPSANFHPWYTGTGFSVYNFILLYFIGRYVKLYWNKQLSWYWYAAAYVLIISVIFRTRFGIYDFANSDPKSYYDNILIVLAALLLFMVFLNIRIKLPSMISKFVLTISSCTMGIYLIHDHPYIRNYVYKNVFHVENYFNSPHLIEIAIISVLSFYCFCTAIEFVRQTLFKLAANSFITLKN